MSGIRSHVVLGLAALVCVAGCARTPTRLPPPVVEDVKTEPLDPKKNQQIQLDLIRGLLERDQYYAALAHIDEARRKGPSLDLTYLEAEVRRHLQQRPAAEALYRKLIGTTLDGQAWHGLGLLMVGSDLDGAIKALRRSAERLPTDVEVRNDLGYALMQAGRYGEALPELSTAAELAPTQIKSRNNLIILMLLTNNQAAVTQLTQQAGTTPEALRQLKDQAQIIRSQQAARTGKAAG